MIRKCRRYRDIERSSIRSSIQNRWSSGAKGVPRLKQHGLAEEEICSNSNAVPLCPVRFDSVVAFPNKDLVGRTCMAQCKKKMVRHHPVHAVLVCSGDVPSSCCLITIPGHKIA